MFVLHGVLALLSFEGWVNYKEKKWVVTPSESRPIIRQSILGTVEISLTGIKLPHSEQETLSVVVELQKNLHVVRLCNFVEHNNRGR